MVGGEVSSKIATDDVENFEVDDGAAGSSKWHLSMDLPSERLYHGAGVVNQELYVVGGRGDENQGGNGDDLRSVMRYDALTGEWDDLAPMHSPRIYVGVAGDSEADLLYAVGGIGGNNGYLKDAEAFDTRTNTWAALPDMNHPRNAPAVVVVDHVLWAIGGYDGNNAYRDTVEWFDVQEDEIACRADPDCVEDVSDWYSEDASGQHNGAEWTEEQHAAGTKDNQIDPNMVGGRRRVQSGCPGDELSQGLNAIAAACNPPDNSQPTECHQSCADVFVPYWASCEVAVTGALPQVAALLGPLVPMCASPTPNGNAGPHVHGFDELAEENGPQLTARQPHACPPEPTCNPNTAAEGSDCANGWGDYHTCMMSQTDTDSDQVPGGASGHSTDLTTGRPHICGDDCDGQW